MKIKIIIIIVAGLITVFMVVFVILAMLSPLKLVKSMNEHVPDSIQFRFENETLLYLEKEVAFLKTRLKMAESDSASLAINLIDSVVIMEIQGVKLLESKIQRIHSSKIFSRFEPQVYFEYFSSPFSIQHDFSTIPKIAFHIKYAPEDTIAAQAPKTIPDSTINNPVYFSLYLDKNLLLDIRQSDTISSDIFRVYNRKLHYERLDTIWNHLYKFQVPPYKPRIRIEIPGNDARAIYKALPRHAQVAIIM